MGKPFRFGIQAGGMHSASSWRELARRAEGSGFETLYMPDHFLETELAPMVGLAVAAEATSTLRVSALVFGNDYKHPAVLAKEIATLDVLSDGRVDLGLGAGWMQTDYAALGIPYDPPGVRVDRLEEALAVVKGTWSGESFSFAGEHYTIRDYVGTPTPVQRPHPPILVGGGGPRVLRLAGREADVVGINPNLRAGTVTNEAARDAVAAMTDRKIEWVREGAGDRFDDLELQIRYFFALITDDRLSLAESVAPGFGLSPEEALDAGIVLVGTVDEVCDTLVERRERWSVTNIVVSPEQMEPFAPVVARLAGT